MLEGGDDAPSRHLVCGIPAFSLGAPPPSFALRFSLTGPSPEAGGDNRENRGVVAFWRRAGCHHATLKMAAGGAPPRRAGRTRVTFALRAWAGAGGGGGRSWAGGSGGRGGDGGGGGSDSAVVRGQPGHRSASSPLPRPSGTLPLAARRAAGAARPWPRSPARCPGPSTRMTTSCRRSSVSGHWGGAVQGAPRM